MVLPVSILDQRCMFADQSVVEASMVGELQLAIENHQGFKSQYHADQIKAVLPHVRDPGHKGSERRLPPRYRRLASVPRTYYCSLSS